MPKLDAEILVFTDANAFFRPDAIRRLVEPFSDPRVGLVCGRLRYVPDAGSFMTDEELYWRYEDVIKTAEGRAGRLLVGNGSIYALRAELFRPIPGSVADDFAMPLLVAATGHRLVYAPDAVAEERLPAQGVENFRAKARIVTRGATALRIYWREVLRSGPLRVVQYLLHKVARWLMGLVLAALFFVSLAGASHPLLATALTAQVAFYLLGVAAYLLARRGPVPGRAAASVLLPAGQRRGARRALRVRPRPAPRDLGEVRDHAPLARRGDRAGAAPRARRARRPTLLPARRRARGRRARRSRAARGGDRSAPHLRHAGRAARPARRRSAEGHAPLLRDSRSRASWQLATSAGGHRDARAAARDGAIRRFDPASRSARARWAWPRSEVVFQINDQGYKGPPLAAPGARPRILVVGDSCAFGSLIDRYSYPRVARA